MTVRLKSGRTLYLRVAMDDESQAKLQSRFASLEELRDIMYLLPTDTEVQSAGLNLSAYDHVYLSDREQFGLLLSTFRAEFETLTEEQKAQVMAPAFNAAATYSKGYDYEMVYPDTKGDGTMRLSLSGRVNGKRFNNEYIITDALPETRRIATYLWGMGQMSGSYIWDEGYGVDGTPAEVLAALGERAEDPKFGEEYPYMKGYVTLLSPSGKGIWNMEGQTTFILNAKDYARFAEILSDACVVTTSTKQQNFDLTENTYCMSLYNEYWDGEKSLSFGVYGVFELSPEELSELVEILYMGE